MAAVEKVSKRLGVRAFGRFVLGVDKAPSVTMKVRSSNVRLI
jgi:hypothetical protein